VVEEPKIVIAGLNSTLAEIHDLPEADPLHQELVRSGRFGHFGWVGEAQLRWFAQQLRPYQE
jgi:hypothetical protein